MAFELRSRVCLFWFQVTFRNAFLKMRVFGCAWKINFPEIIFSYFPDSHLEREREREREPSPQTTVAHSLDRAPVRRPQIKLQFDDPHSTGFVDRSTAPIAPDRIGLAFAFASTTLIKQRSTPTLLDLAFASAAWSNPVASLSSFFSQFDWIWWIFFSGFCFFCVSVLRNDINICLTAEKMWATSKKCVFYDIFKNTIKQQKIFFKTFFEMQQNTWKYFPFPKIAFPKNIYFPENILHEPNTAL